MRTVHPCFHESASRRAGRIHLPIASTCNIQCNYCNRRYDCVNESRPGVSSLLLNEEDVISYLRQRLSTTDSISVIGIAGPGDPLADPGKIRRICSEVHYHYPEMLLCISTNGLNLVNHVDALADAGVTHVTVTVNAVDADVGGRIYQWVQHDGLICHGPAAATILWAAQSGAIKKAKARGLTVKVNTVVIPGINDDHVEAVARACAGLGADIMNCIPMIPVASTPFGGLSEISKTDMSRFVCRAAKHIRQMRHCVRCRADASGLLSEVAGISAHA